MDTDFLRTELRKEGFQITKLGVVRTQKNPTTMESPYDLMVILRNNIVRLPSGRDVNLSLVNSIKVSNRFSGIKLITPFETIDVPKSLFSTKDLKDLETSNVTTVMPKKLSQLNDMFIQLYPNYKEQLYYDQMREREVIDRSMFDPSEKKGTFTELDDVLEYTYYDNIERRLEDLGCEGMPPSSVILWRSLMMKIHETKKNFFRDWVLSVKWDGKPRVDTWFKNIFGATANPLKALGLEDIYLAKVARAWFVGGISRIYQPTQCDVIPVFISTDQGAGKTTGLIYTAGKEEWYGPTNVDITSPKGVENFLNAVRGKVVVELAEGSTIKSKKGDDPESIKAFISTKSDQYRKAYGHHDESYPRHFIMASTSNIDNLFTDLTGNRRFFPMYAHECDRSIRTDYDVQQMWAEAHVMYMCGEKPWIYQDWKPSLIMQEYCLQDNCGVDVIDGWLDDPSNGYSELGARISKDELFRQLFHYGEHTLPSKEHKDAWNDWTIGTKCWKKVENPYKVNGRSVRGYYRCKKPGEASSLTEATIESIKKMSPEERKRVIEDAHNRSEMVPYDELIEYNNKDKEEEPEEKNDGYKDWCNMNGVFEIMQAVPIQGISMAQLTDWVSKGYVCFNEEEGQYVNLLGGEV